MSTFYTTSLSKSDFSFVLLLETFEPLQVEQSYIPLLKALICGINGAQGCSCMSTFCHAPLKIALLLHKMTNGPYSMSETVSEKLWYSYNHNEMILIQNILPKLLVRVFMFCPYNQCSSLLVFVPKHFFFQSSPYNFLPSLKIDILN